MEITLLQGSIMKLKSTLILLISIYTVIAVNADNTTNQMKGEATIIINNDTYMLPLKNCYSSTNIVDGKKYEAFVVTTHLSRKGKGTEPRFTAIGSKAEKTAYKLQIDGGFLKGGTGYRGQMPFESFKSNKLTFEGMASSIKKENNKSVKGLVPIKITVNCH